MESATGDDRGAEPSLSGVDPFHLRMSLHPGHWNAIRPDMLLGYEEQARKSCHLSLVEMQPFAGREPETALRALGFGYHCPDGGAMRLTEEGLLECGIHGSPAHPRQPAAPTEANPVSRILENLDEITFSLRLTEDGIHSTVRIER
jgi:hypothetical protein